MNNDNMYDVDNEILDDFVDSQVIDNDEENNHKNFFLILLFLICLIFLVSSLSFAIFNTYYNGGFGNIIDLGTKIVIDDDKDTDKDKDKDSESHYYGGNIETGTVLFSYNERSPRIYMENVLPIKDDIGMKLSGDNEYFDFGISSRIKTKKKGKLTYEISLVPLGNNTIDNKDIRVYLTEDGKSVSVNKNIVNNFSDLPNSKYRNGAKVIYRKTVSNSIDFNYVFRMWYSYDAYVTNEVKQFGCIVVVDAYYI